MRRSISIRDALAGPKLNQPGLAKAIPIKFETGHCSYDMCKLLQLAEICDDLAACSTPGDRRQTRLNGAWIQDYHPTTQQQAEQLQNPEAEKWSLFCICRNHTCEENGRILGAWNCRNITPISGAMASLSSVHSRNTRPGRQQQQKEASLEKHSGKEGLGQDVHLLRYLPQSLHIWASKTTHNPSSRTARRLEASEIGRLDNNLSTALTFLQPTPHPPLYFRIVLKSLH